MMKITVNGVAYASVDAMPPDVRRIYEETVSRIPDLADRDGDGLPDMVGGEGLTVRNQTVVRKKFIVDGRTYEDEKDLPTEIREACRKAMHAVDTTPRIETSQVKMSFQLSGPGFTIRKVSGSPSPSSHSSAPRPIEPASAGGLRAVLVLAACAVAGLLLWIALRAR